MIKEIGKSEILIDKIEISKELKEVQTLMEISKEDRERLKESIRLNGIRDPLKGYDLKGKFQLLSGWTRLEIGKELGIEKVSIVTISGNSSKEYSEFAISENFDRRQLSNEQKRKLIEYKLRINPEKSDRQIGRETNSDNKTVSKKRKEMESQGEIEKVTRKDSKGRNVGEKEKKDPRGEIPHVKIYTLEEAKKKFRKPEIKNLLEEIERGTKKMNEIKTQIKTHKEKLKSMGIEIE